MNRIKSSLVIIIITLSLLWWLSDPAFWATSDSRALQMALINYSGILAIGLIAKKPGQRAIVSNIGDG
jgi:hypothetical protein